ncbi:bestrophin-3-like isoform X1 [Macrosteles quadrilineatus]|nr:bestrophin-3-like isoform X1 [Macrosteles quadrilineatus]
MHSLALYIGGNDIQGRMIRRTLMRYLNLSLILVLRSISSAVKRRFPTMDHLVEAGFMTRLELEMFQAVPNMEFNTYWIPCTWFIALLKDTKKSNRIVDSQGLKIIVEEFNEFRSKCGLLWSYDWISIPLVYTQVVTLATYSFFLAALVGRQYVDETTSQQKKQFQMEVDIYIPLFTILQFFFYMGLLKVAEQLINPFGDDDEDFELNWLIDRHTKVSYLGVDTLMSRYPPLVKDKYFDDINLILPYTGAAFAYKKKTYRGSVHNMQVPEDQQSMFLPEISEEEEDDRDSSSKRGSSPKKTSSFTNLMNAVSPPAGIWRASSERPSVNHSGDVEANFQSAEVTAHFGLKKFDTRAPWQTQSIPVPIPISTLVRPDMHEWPSQSTLDSVDSNQLNHESPGIKITNPFDESFKQVQKLHEKIDFSLGQSTDGNEMIKSTSSSRNSIPLATRRSKGGTIKYSSTGNIVSSLRHSFNKHVKDFKSDERSTMKKLLSRRQSTASGQWKGVRWKPVIDDSAGDIWSDNSGRRPSNDSHCRLKQPSTASAMSQSHLSSSESITSSFQSLTSHNELEPFTQPSLGVKDFEDLRSRSWMNVPRKESQASLAIKEPLTVSSLPNICLSSSQPLTSSRSRSHSLLLGLGEELPAQSLKVLQKSYSTSPRIFSNLQETIEEENEMKQ